MAKTTKAEQRQAEIEDAAFAHFTHDSLNAPVSGCGFCAVECDDREHRAYLDATPDAWEHHHGRG